MNINPRVRWVATTGVFLALLLTLQAFTSFGGQVVTGSLVNLILAASVFGGGYWCAFAVALLSPFCAFLLGVGPKLLPLVPFISLGNLAFISLLSVIGRRDKLFERCGAVGFAAVLKFIVLWSTIVCLVIPSLGLPEPQMNALALTFSWPQVMTAMIGGCLAAAFYPMLNKLHRQRSIEM